MVAILQASGITKVLDCGSSGMNSSKIIASTPWLPFRSMAKGTVTSVVVALAHNSKTSLSRPCTM